MDRPLSPGRLPKTKGPLVVASRVDLFKDAGGAKA